MSAFKSEQRHLIVRGRAFHFVSYEGRPANAHRGEDQQPPMWYLMVEGRRFAAFPCDAHQAGAELDAALARWAEDNAMGPTASAAAPPAKKAQSGPVKRRGTWWGPN